MTSYVYVTCTNFNLPPRPTTPPIIPLTSLQQRKVDCLMWHVFEQMFTCMCVTSLIVWRSLHVKNDWKHDANDVVEVVILQFQLERDVVLKQWFTAYFIHGVGVCYYVEHQSKNHARIQTDAIYEINNVRAAGLRAGAWFCQRITSSSRWQTYRSLITSWWHF